MGDKHRHAHTFALYITQQTHTVWLECLVTLSSFFSRMEHGDRGLGVSHLRYEDEEGECLCASVWPPYSGSITHWPHVPHENGKVILPILYFNIIKTDHTNL